MTRLSIAPACRSSSTSGISVSSHACKCAMQPMRRGCSILPRSSSEAGETAAGTGLVDEEAEAHGSGSDEFTMDLPLPDQYHQKVTHAVPYLRSIFVPISLPVSLTAPAPAVVLLSNR